MIPRNTGAGKKPKIKYHKRVYKILVLLVLLPLFLMSGCGSVKDYVADTPIIFFAYPDDTPIIKEQSEIATIIYPSSDYSVIINGVRPLLGGWLAGKRSMRATREKIPWGSPHYAIDILPGIHEIKAKQIAGTM